MVCGALLCYAVLCVCCSKWTPSSWSMLLAMAAVFGIWRWCVFDIVATCCRRWVSWMKHVSVYGVGATVAMLHQWCLAHNNKSTNAAFLYLQSPTGFSTVSTEQKKLLPLFILFSFINLMCCLCMWMCVCLCICNNLMKFPSEVEELLQLNIHSIYFDAATWFDAAQLHSAMPRMINSLILNASCNWNCNCDCDCNRILQLPNEHSFSPAALSSTQEMLLSCIIMR